MPPAQPHDGTTDDAARAALSAAVRADDAAQVTAVLAAHPGLARQLDAPLVPDTAFGATPLLAAVTQGNREMVDVLLAAGADINARSHWWAGSFGVLDRDSDLVPYLIERGATVDVHAASRHGLLDRVRQLVAADPGLVAARGGDGQTPLHVASSLAIAEYLLDHGADIDARDVDHESTPAMYMVRDRQEIARDLVERGCQTDILMVAALGDPGRVRRHLDADPPAIHTTVSDRYFPKRNPRSGGCIYNWTLGRDKSAHVIAREFGHAEVFDLLMARTPEQLQLAVACELEDGQLVAALLARNPDLGRTLEPAEQRRIANAARDGKLASVRLMLAAGWPVNATGQHGATPLHWAAWNGHLEMAADLIGRGARLDLRDGDYDGTPLNWAVYGSAHGWHCQSGDYPGTVDALLRAGAPRLPAEAITDATDAVREVLRRHGDAS